MNSIQVYYLTRNIKTGDKIYDIKGESIGEFTGYCLRPGSGPDQNGAVECVKNNGEHLFIEGMAVFVKGMGIKFVEEYVVK